MKEIEKACRYCQVTYMNNEDLVNEEEPDFVLSSPDEMPLSDWKWYKIWALTTDNPNVTKSTRTKLMDTTKAKWIAYGCAPHSLNKFAHDLLKLEPFKTNHENTTTLVSYFN